jgi:hypothetical protein
MPLLVLVGVQAQQVDTELLCIVWTYVVFWQSSSSRKRVAHPEFPCLMHNSRVRSASEQRELLMMEITHCGVLLLK